jgi:hypothetical protein
MAEVPCKHSKWLQIDADREAYITLNDREGYIENLRYRPFKNKLEVTLTERS